ncbi:MAG: acetylxylan esterase [Clostridia bacterium]|nr:acetylxylan esterase [Clostridia bacterium]
MSFLQEKIHQLGLPVRPDDRQVLIRTLLEQEYGIIPPIPCKVEGRTVAEDKRFCAGKAPLQTIELTLTLPGGSFTFPVKYARPTAAGVHPLFVLLNFTANVPDQYYPAEEICDRGYAVLSAGYNDISKDAADDYTDGLGKLLREAAAQAGVPAQQLPGKIAIWAWAASRMLDWALTQPGVEAERTAVIGHSRLGKTALLAGMLDERFACVISNASGCSGAAITRGKPGEHISNITDVFPFWFCENYRQYADNEAAMPFEQDWLLAAIAPRLLCVSSGLDDQWAGPSHEFLGCVAASSAWEALGKPGFITPDRMPAPGDALQEGSISYHLRPGDHYLSREDWGRFMDFLDGKGWRK